MDVRVFYFTGLLGSGKTTFIDKTIADLDPQLKSVVICAEVGDEDFSEGVPVEYAGKLSWKLFESVQDKYQPDIVFIEDDGQNRPAPDDLVRMLPDNWFLSQVVCMINGASFEHYINTAPNMIMEKIMPASMVIINRCTDQIADYLREQSLRMVNRDAEFWLEFVDEHVENYIRDDESYFDLSGDMLEISPDEFPVWYTEALDFPDRFENFTINIDLMVDHDMDTPEYDVAGLWLMTCCEADIAFYPVACKKGMLKDFATEDMVNITAIVRKTDWDEYQGEGPLLEIIDARKSEGVELN